MPDGDPRRRVRALVLTADVGEGHVAAARALAEGLRGLGSVDVAERDGLAAFGAVLRHVMRDGYRWQLRWAPRTYDVMYRVLSRVRLARAIGELVLSAAGRRRLRRIVRREAPDVVISTHPALTCVLGRMRLRRRLDVPVCATVTDFAGYGFWSHRGADRHLVMHADVLAAVERIAGTGSATLVRPFVAEPFLVTEAPSAARARLGLAGARRVVVVSGGGWGVGDLAGATDAALGLGDVTVVALAGRDDDVRSALIARFEGEPRVHVWGFTDRMPDLLRAADVVVHSTGGMTSIEALSCGCPLIAYGSAIGHIQVHNRALAALGLIRVAGTRAELAAALRAMPAGPRERGALSGPGGAHPAAAVVGARPRVRPLPAWRIAGAHAVAATAAAVAVVAGLATDDAYSLAARPLELRPVRHVTTTRREAALVVRANPAAAMRVAGDLAAAGAHASFATTRRPSGAFTRALAALGDDTLPELAPAGRVDWLATRAQLRGAAPEAGDRRYLAPASGLGLAQYLLARSLDASPVAGAVTVGPSGRGRAAAPGDIVVLTADGAPALRAAVASLRSGGLSLVPLSSLLASTNVRTARAVVSSTAPPVTTVSPATIPAHPRGA